jgi:hypothetical protein
MALDRRTTAIVVLVVLAAAAGGVAAGAVVSSRGNPPVRTTEAAATGTTGPAGPTGTPSPTSTGTPSAAATRPTVPVYLLGGMDTGPRLYREFRRVGAPAGSDPARLAASALAAAPGDPDYRTPWAGVPVTALRRSGTDATVAFGAGPSLAAGEATLAVQQVVYTVTAADPDLKRVRVLAPGLPGALTAKPLARAPQLDVLAPVWLLSPADGARSGRRVVLSGTASVFEASVAIEVRSGASVAARTTATASAGAPARGTWTATVMLPPGDYTVAAYEVSAKDGSRQFTDTKRVKVT